MGDETNWIRALTRVAGGVAALACLLVAALWASATFHAQPMMDDFQRGGVPLGELFQYVGHHYTSWMGRWAAAALEVLLLSPFEPTTAYGARLLLLVVVHAVCVDRFARAFAASELSVRERVGVAGLFGALFWSGMPAPGPTLHWISGGIENQLGLSLTLALFAELRHARRGAGPFALARITLLALVITGLHEVFGGITLMATAVGAAGAWREGRPTRRLWLATCGILALGLAVTVAAPGNAVRADLHFADAGDLERTLEFTIATGLDWLPRWLLDPKLLGLTIALVFQRRWRIDASDARFPWLLALPAVTAVAIVGCFAGPVYATNHPAQMRTLDGAYFVFLVGWFATVLVARERLGPSSVGPRLGAVLGSTGLIVFAIGVLASRNVRAASWDLRDRLAPWSAAQAEYHALGRAAEEAGERLLELPPCPPTPRIFPMGELSTDPEFGANQLFAAYYGLRAVRVRAESD